MIQVIDNHGGSPVWGDPELVDRLEEHDLCRRCRFHWEDESRPVPPGMCMAEKTLKERAGFVLVMYGCHQFRERPTEDRWEAHECIEPSSFESGWVAELVHAAGEPVKERCMFTGPRAAVLAEEYVARKNAELELQRRWKR